MYIFVCVEACDHKALVAMNGMTNRHEHGVCGMSMGGKISFKHAAIISVDHVVEARAKKRLYLVMLAAT